MWFDLENSSAAKNDIGWKIVDWCVKSLKKYCKVQAEVFKVVKIQTSLALWDYNYLGPIWVTRNMWYVLKEKREKPKYTE